MADDDYPENLDELLDSALKDFDKNKAQKAEAKKENDEKTSTDEQTDGGSGAVGPDAFFEEHAKLLSERMKTLFGGSEAQSSDTTSLAQDPERFLAGIKEVAQAAAMTLEGTSTANDEEVAKYSDIIAEALKGIQDGTDNINSNVDDSDVLSMLNNLNLDGSGDGTTGEDGNVFLPFMEGMVQSLFSAEILLPSTMEILAIYPKYLEENADKLSPEDKERYEKQYELYKVIEGLLKTEDPNDSASVKREKFRRVFDEMRKLQDLGNVPPEILNATTPDLSGLEPLMNNAGANSGGPQCPMM